MASTTTDNDMKHQMSEPGLRVSKLPKDIQAEVGRLNLDKDADGKINSGELRDMIVELLSTKKDMKSLRKVTIVLAIYGIFLTFAIFGVSIAAARLAKDTTIDAETGNLMVKGSKDGQLIHTSPVSYDHQDLSIVALNNKELSGLTKINLRDGDVEFAVKGFARSLINETVVIFVEGGSLIFDINGLKDVTGDELKRISSSSSVDEDMTSVDLDGRKLFFWREDVTINRASTSSTAWTSTSPRPCTATSMARVCVEERAEARAAGPITPPCTGYTVGRNGNLGRCGYNYKSSCPFNLPYCIITSGRCDSDAKSQNAQESTEFNYCLPAGKAF